MPRASSACVACAEPAVSHYPAASTDDLAERIRATAEIRYVPRIGQPVTFGLFRPIVLLPETFPTLPPTLQRAVLAHELWHIRRRDWGWVLIEEGIRAVLWFNPAVSWIVGRVQATREEVVDELTVQLTNARKAYLEALLIFADEPTLFPAAPLARRRHLFQRMLLISREAVMSSTRILSSFAAAMAVVTGAGWYGATMFPLSAATIAAPATEVVSVVRPAASAPAPAIATAAPAPLQTPTRDRRPGEAAPETIQERQLKQAIEATPTNRELYFSLAALQQARGAGREFEATLRSARQAFPNDIATLTMIARAYLRIGRFDDSIVALQEVAALDPANPASQHLIAVHYWEKAFKDAALTPAQKLAYIHSGIAATDKALAQDPDYVDSLIYKNILLRMEANLDPVNAASLLVQADALRERATELQRTRAPQRGVPGGVQGGVPGGVQGGVATGRRGEMVFVPAPGAPPPPPPPPPGVEASRFYPPPPTQIDGMTPMRIGGDIRPPRKIKDVHPIYPPIAQSARVQGVIIIEAIINATGDVVHARVLRGQPLLDQAALEAVEQWQFQPTLVKGVPTPIIMTVTVNFVLE